VTGPERKRQSGGPVHELHRAGQAANVSGSRFRKSRPGASVAPRARRGRDGGL